MKRTFEVDENGSTYYRNKYIGYLQYHIRERFSMFIEGRYEVSITKGGAFSFSDLTHSTRLSALNENGRYLGAICIDDFEKLFFKPDRRKTYNVVVKKK